jgi:hypothetical protein
MKNFLGNLEVTVTGQTDMVVQEFIESHDLQHVQSATMTMVLANGKVVEVDVMIDAHKWETEEYEEELV